MHLMNNNGIKPLQDLNLEDDFLFAKVMEDEKVSRLFLQNVLGVAIERVEVVSSEYTIELSTESRGIRLDVYLKDHQGTVYNGSFWKRKGHIYL